MNEMMNQLQSLKLENAFEWIAGSGEKALQMNMTMAIILVVAALLICFLGLKLLRVWSALAGLGTGFLVGGFAGMQFTGNPLISMIIGLVLGVGLGALLAWWLRGGAFLTAFLLTCSIAIWFVKPDSQVKLVICLVIGLVLSILAEVIMAPVIILLSGLQGGTILLSAIPALQVIPGNNKSIIYVIAGVLTVLGIFVQFALEFKRKVKQNVAQANKIRATESTENDVDRARQMIDDLDGLEDIDHSVEYEDDDEYYEEDDEYYEDGEEYEVEKERAYLYDEEKSARKAVKKNKKETKKNAKKNKKKSAEDDDIIFIDL
ncbi:MAG: TMEM198/TM7SF3 family protein [Hespellia sp.]|nr:TMEM198/TM7SF3 family protein [Hespellia sp.]